MMYPRLLVAKDLLADDGAIFISIDDNEIENVKNITTQEFKKAGDLIVLVGQTFDDFSGSELQKMLIGEISGRIDFDLETEKINQDFVLKAITDGLVSSAHDLAEGGLAIALAESAFANGLGVDVKVDITNAQLFSETQGRFILSISPENQATFEKLLTESSVSGEVIGKVTDSGILEMNELSISTDEAVSIYEGVDIDVFFYLKLIKIIYFTLKKQRSIISLYLIERGFQNEKR